MDFVISAASKSSDVRILQETFSSTGGVFQHVRGVLVTPLFSTDLTLRLCCDIQAEFRIPIMFDSGGYAVQTGRIDYFEMYGHLLEFYRRERWAGLYTLPDNVPTNKDTDVEVEAKVRQTTECSALFYREMPSELRDRALGVVHGHTLAQIEFCLDRYLRIGLRHIGFGSFGTSGQNSDVNILTNGALANARALTKLARERGLTVHLFGVGSPATLPWLACTGATSFDSANWAKGAGFGQVFLPLTRGYNVTHRSIVSPIQRGLSRDDFEKLRALSGHSCPYCASFDLLQTSRVARAAHNILATIDSLEMIAKQDHCRMSAIYAAASPKYGTLWKRGMAVK